MNIYAGNLSYNVTDEDLKEIFGAYGEVSRASVISDRETGRSKGFGFVEMPVDDEAKQAIDALNGKDVKGRTMNVNEARPRPDRPQRPPRRY
ncbi:MAG: RNA-binding protein [Candidatus Hydrogenedentes bacterium]|jgi:RNA recognition motif-containing protein|nr:RNA-binding protein [Candidatus Hydrogenedentota bacterium]